MTQLQLFEKAEAKAENQPRTRRAVVESRFSGLSMWFRDQPELDSWNGNNIQDLDFIYENKNTGNYVFLEEKSKCGKLRKWQSLLFGRIAADIESAPKFRGFWIVWLTGKSPSDGPVSVENIRTGLRYDAVNLAEFLLWVTR